MKHCILAPPKRTILYTNNEQILSIGQALLLRSIAAFIMVLLLYTLQTLPAYAQATVNVSYEAVNIPDPVEVGQEISYKIKWSCASSTSDCDTFDLNYTLPSGFDFVSMATPPGYSASETGGVVNINTPTLNGGDSAEATLVLRVGYSEAPDNNFPVQGTLAVTTDTGAALNETDPLDPITLDPPTTQWDVTKTKTQPAGSTEPAVDNPVGYRLQYCSASTTGNVDIANAVLVDTFPAGATVVDPDGGNVSGNTITWNIGTLNYYPPNNCVTKNILLQYPTPTFATGQSIDNHVDGTGAAGTSSDGPIGDDTQTNTLSAPLVEIDFNKSSETQIVGPNALAEFTFSVDNSQSNVTASNFVIEETVPPELKLTHIKTGQWRDAISVTARIEYQNRGSSTWNVLGTVDFNDDRTYTGADAGGSAFTTDVGKVRWVFFTASGAAGIPSGFETTTSPRIWAMPSTPIAADTNTVTNCAAANYTDPNGSSTLIEDSCGDVEITDTPITITDIDKRSNPTNNIVPGEPINYSIDLKLLAESSADWINPVVTDTLPAEMTFISWNNVASDFNNGVPANTLPTFTTSTLPSGATQLIWSWTGANAWTVEESELARTTKTHTIKYTAQVKEGVPPGGYDNVANYTSDSPNEDCNNGPCEDTHTANVRDVGIFQSDKWVAGDPFLNHVDFVANPANSHILYSPFDPSCPDDGTGLTRFPCIARSYPLETFPYKLEVRNAGNVELRDYVLYDVLPHAGDTGVSEVLQGDPRGSLWQPLLTGPVIPSSLPAPLTASDIVIEYSDAFNSCRPEVSGSSNENGWQTGCVNDWTTTPDNWDDVKSFKIYFKDSTVKWPPQTDMIFSITMLIPNTNVPSGSIAWNSVAHRATNDFSDSRLLTADPKKVGIAVLYYDWGDLPDLDADSTASPAYDTDIATQGGARHLILPELYLGAGVDAELDGQPNDGANGDDSNVGDHNFGTVPASGDDEDGIKFLNDVIMPGDPVGIEVSAFISGTPGVTATLGIWVDLNGDGDFTDPNEYTVRTLTNPAGTGATIVESISLVAPSDVGETIYSRFRLAFNPDEVGQIDDTTGSARSGEVEDYVLMSLGDTIWMDNGIGGGTPDNGLLDGGEQGIPGVVVELHDTSGNLLATTTTDANGNYLFTGLPEDDYVVHIPASNFISTGALVDLSSSNDSTAGIGNDPDTDQDNSDDNGIDDPNAVVNGISSAPVTLEFGTEPTDEGNGGSSNRSVDFGFLDYDWGDLPDGNNTISPDYNTSAASGGAAHVIIPGLYMGGGVDPETNGQPSSTATGDDAPTGNDTTDDEDGVTFPPIVAGQTVNIPVSVVNTTTEPATVYGFIDFDGDGAFTGPGETVSAVVPPGTTAGTTNLAFNVPLGSPINNTVGARFRLSTDVSLGPDGIAPDGEVEDYLVEVIGHEYGDLPDQYGTVHNGTVTIPAVHIVTDTLHFGTQIDHEGDGNPDGSAGMGTAGGDDHGGIDDEDGIVFMTPMMPGTTAVISMTAHVDPAINGDGTAYYGAWIDLDGDGTFGAGEHFTGELINGETVLNVPIPAGATISDTVYSRFRTSANQTEVDDPADHIGLAQTGEVEDYILMSLGNRVFLDADGTATADDGAMGAGEAGIDGVTVELYRAGDTPGVDPPIATTTTANGGEYLFTGLAEDDYVVHLPASNFGTGQPLEGLTSSSDTATSGNVDPDGDADDESTDENGVDNADPATNGISSQSITLEAGDEPNNDGNGPNSNLTVDFGLVYYDLSLVKSRSAGQDYAANFTTTPPTASFDITVENQGPTTAYNVAVLDSIPAGMSVQSFNGVITGTATVNASGPASPTHTFTIDVLSPDETVTFQVLLQIDDLSHGVYTNVAEISDMENSSGTSVPDIDSTPDSTPGNDLIDTSANIDPNGDDDDNSHNDLDFGGTDGSEPGAIVDPATAGDEDDHDQEVIVGGLALGNRVWYDGNNSGTVDGTEQGIGNVLVEVYAVDAAGNPVGGPYDTATTDANGYWLVDNLPPGDYIAVIPASNFASGMPLADMQSSSDIGTSASPENGQESDDNGIGMSPTGGISSGVITLDPIAGEPQQGSGESDLNPTGHGNAGDFFDNLTVDFGFIQYDLGDAPDSYGTTQANNGARHIQDGVTFLGSSVDPELDGQPSNNADGDDTLTGNDGADDEDGVTFLTPIMAGEPFTIEVEAGSAGYLNSWIDFDGSGTFDAGEQITSDQPLAPGTHSLTFTAPANVDDDSLYSRFRFTADSGEATTPMGEATSGEVEDYVLMSLGDTVWLDNGAGSAGGGAGSVNANNGMQDGTEAGIANVTIELYAQGDTPGVDDPIATTTTDASGNYLFTGLVPGDYSIYLPPSNFANGAPLEDHFSSSDPGGVAVDPDNNQDMDDNGAGDGYSDPITNGILSVPVTLDFGTEPDGTDGDGNQSNRTVDFGLVQYDKGDLPDINVGESPGDYETLTTMGHDGAMHVIVPDVFLGSSVDAEANGQPDVEANGDNDGDNNDEDGVVFTSLLIPGQNATVDVEANVDGFLNAWVDFNGDGDFNDPGEQISSDQPLAAGTNSLTYPVPAGMLASDLYTRFRFTSDDPAGQLDANGAWDNGEVEDYVLHGLTLGNQVWHDLDDDGARDANEPPIDGVLVNLIDPATGNVIMTDTTASGGYYIFDNLLSGDPGHQDISSDYIVEIAASNFAPGGPLENMYSSNPTEADPDADIDLNDNGINPPPIPNPQLPATSYPLPTPIQSGVVSLSDYGEPITESEFGPAGHGNAPDESSNLTVDFGFYLPVTVGDIVFYDHDQDGIQDGPATEPGVPGIDVTLYDSITGQPILDSIGNPLTMTTDVNGEYLFEELPPGRYHVQFDLADLPQNYIVTAPHVGNNISIDSNANPSLGTTDSTPFLYSGAQDLTLDMGIMLLEDVRVGDRVWFDDNLDGIQDIGETGVPSVTVTLYDNATGLPFVDAAGNPMTTTTDVGGNYLFDELPPGDYYVQFDLNTLPPNYFVTTQDATNNQSPATSDQIDSDADPNMGVTPPTGMLNSTEQDLSLDMGIYRLDNVEVGDRVWYDDNRDGIQGPNEGGVPNVGVTLYDTATGMPILDAMGNSVTTMTDVNGGYLFTDLPPGDYFVAFDPNSLPLNYTWTAPDVGSDDTLDSDGSLHPSSLLLQTSPTGMLNSNDSDLTLDMGIHRNDNVQVGDTVWYDNDRDGIQDAGEPGVPGVGVTLYDTTTGAPVTDSAGNPLSQTTDANGNYLFGNLPPGDYFVAFDQNTLPPNYTWTAPNVGSNDAMDSDASLHPLSSLLQTSATGFLSSNASDLSLDLGIHRQDNVTVGDRVWYDDNRDGIQDPGEAGVSNVLAVLYDTATGQPITDMFGVPMIDLTDSNGEYLFENLPPGDYYVEFQLSTLPTGYVVTQPNATNNQSPATSDQVDSDADQSTGRTVTTGYLQSNEEDRTLDMGIYRPEGVRVGDRVWLDNNQDGIQDGNEAGVSGVTVTLVDSAGNPVTQDRDGNPITPQVTDGGQQSGSGNYLFDNLPDGDYAVIFDLSTLPANHVVTSQDSGGDDLLDSDADPNTGATPSTGPLIDGDENLSLDMGIYPLSEVMVGDTVWYDNNADGIQDANETGVAGVVVSLFNADGTPVTDVAGNPVSSTATDSNGNYLFDNLPAGDYYVEFDLTSLPSGYLVTQQDITDSQSPTTSDQSDSDADPVTGQTASTGPLADGDADLSLDMGIFQPASLGDIAWDDLNRDGVQDPGEPGIAGVTVALFNGDGTPTLDLNGNPMTTTTDANGNYQFDNLLPGDYYVEFTTPIGYNPSPQDSGGNDSEDSDADPMTGQTVVTMLTSGENDPTWDAGFYQPDPMGRPTPEPTATPEGTPTPEPEESATPEPEETVTPEPEESATPEPEETVTPEPEESATPEPEETVTPEPEDTPTADPEDTSTPAPESTLTPGLEGTPTSEPEDTPTADPEDTATLEPESTLTPGLEGTPTSEPEDTPTAEPEGTATPEPEDTATPEPEGTPTSETEDTPTAEPEVTPTPILSPSTPTPTPTPEPVSVGNYVWYDNDGDGVQESGESGVEGLTVTLYNVDGTLVTDLTGNPVGPIMTDPNGEYLFDNLPEGEYYVTFDLGTLPAGYQATTQDATNNQSPVTSNQTDSDGDPVTGQTGTTGPLSAGEMDDTLDLGIVAPVAVGDRVWYDNDSNGIQGSGESGVEGVTVVLLNTDGTPVTDMAGNPVGPAVTDSNGNYLFDNLPPGDYQVMFDLDTIPANHRVTQQNAINNQSPATSNQSDSDADPTTGLTAPTGMLLAGEEDRTLDMGITPIFPVTIGDQVWEDSNRDGVQDGGEPGVEGVIVTLTNADGRPVVDLDGDPVTSVTTDGSGNYIFDNLPPGDYVVQFDPRSLPAGYTITTPNSGSDDDADSDADSDADPDSGETAPTGFLPDGTVIDGLDMGIVPAQPVSVGNRVWYDNNNDGIQDAPADEPGVAGVGVMIFNTDGTSVTDIDGNSVLLMVTDDNGEYLFDNLPPGDYYVQFDLSTLPANYGVTQANATHNQSPATSDQTDSDANTSTGETASTGFLPSGSEDLTLDMGIVQAQSTIRVGDRVWLDEDQDGIQDAGEPGVEGVTVNLYDTSTGDLRGTTVTDSSGNYLFDGLPAGDYFVRFDLSTLPGNHLVTQQDATNNQSPTTSDRLEDDQIDSDVDPETGQTSTTGILFAGEEDLSLDLGIYPADNVAVGDLVWYDLDGDGIQDADEPGVENVTVTLYDSGTNQPVPGVQPQQTDRNGNYLFENLPAGDYYVIFDLDSLPDGYGVTEADVITDQQPVTSDQTDSDVSASNGSTAPTGPLSGNETDMTLDMGIVALVPVSIGDYVWFDDNANGIQDPNEEGVPGVSVYLYDEMTGQPMLDEKGEPLAQVTDTNGEYLFTDVPPGQYHVLFDLSTLPEGYVLSPVDQEVSDNADSDAGSDGATPPTDVLTYGDIDRSLDMGIYKPVEIGDTVWFDDGNGQQDPGEEGVSGVGVTLYDVETGEIVGTTTTDSNGNYLFKGLPPGNYQVEFDLTTLPEGYMVTRPDLGNDDGADSDADPTTGRAPETGFLSSGGSDRSLDMGLVLPISIGDTVWMDENFDGIQDAGEPGVDGVTVTLYDAAGNPVATTTTDSGQQSGSGNYLFEGVLPGEYAVGFDLDTLPEGYVVTQANVINDQSPANSDQTDSDANPETGRTASTGFLTSGTAVTDLDMGIRIPDEDLVRIGGRLWEDTDLDGEVDPEEGVWPTVPVMLYSQDDPTTPITTVLTDADGNYLFENLPPGDYFISLSPDGLPEGTLPPIYSGGASSDELRANSGTLDQGSQVLNLNMALNRPGSLSGSAWLDQDGDGVRSADEGPLSNVTVELYDATGEKVGEMVTDENGAYTFDNLLPGEYRVVCPATKGYNLSPNLQGEDGSRDSDIDPATNESSTKFVGSGQHLPDVDLGLYERASITNLLWNDVNGDGVQDANEAGLAGITVFLFNEAGEIVGETVTDNEGRYGFGNLAAGNYYAAFEAPDGMMPGQALLREGTDLVRGPMISVDGGNNASANDIGFTQVAALGNYVWLDTNKDGLVDPDEAGIAGAIVRLLDEDGSLLEITTTDSDGRFEFLVVPGNYQLEFLPRDGMEFTAPNQGDDSKDSDVDPETGRTAVISIAPSENNISNFAGMIISPTAIQLMSLTATETASGVRVEWITGSEIDTFGFQILRSRTGSLESAVEVTEDMVLAGNSDGLYEFIDTTARAGQVYSYWLVEVQNDQTILEYGPTRVVVEGLRRTTDGFRLFLPLVQK